MWFCNEYRSALSFIHTNQVEIESPRRVGEISVMGESNRD